MPFVSDTSAAFCSKILTFGEFAFSAPMLLRSPGEKSCNID